MKELHRLNSRKYTLAEIQPIVDQVVRDVVRVTEPLQIVLFGSAARGEFDDYSDIDLVVIYETIAQAKSALVEIQKARTLKSRGIDYLCVDRATYEEKSNLGGVFFDARAEGVVVYSSPPTA